MKSKSSKAMIPLLDSLKEEMNEWFYINPYEKVICDEDGNYLDPDCTGNRLRSISKKNRNTIPFPFIETHLYYVSY